MKLMVAMSTLPQLECICEGLDLGVAQCVDDPEKRYRPLRIRLLQHRYCRAMLGFGVVAESAFLESQQPERLKDAEIVRYLRNGNSRTELCNSFIDRIARVRPVLE